MPLPATIDVCKKDLFTSESELLTKYDGGGKVLIEHLNSCSNDKRSERYDILA